MIKIEYEYTKNNKINNLHKIIQNAMEQAKSDCGEEIKYVMRNWIETSGEGTWSPLRQMTMHFSRNRNGSPLAFLAPFVQYSTGKNFVDIGFLPGKKVYSKFINRYLYPAEYGRKVKVTPKMRRYLGAKEFPIKKSTTILEIPKRPILFPVFEKTKNRLSDIFSQSLQRSLGDL